MRNDTNATYYYPNHLGRILLQAMEEVLGRNGVIAVLKQARLDTRINNYPKSNLDKKFRFDEVSQIQNALEASYGIRGGRGLALREGRVCFKIILRELGVEIGLTELASHPRPVDEKVRMTLEILAELFNKYSDQQVVVSQTGMKYLWTVNRCPFCWHLRVEDPICLQQVGLLQEALYWVSSGKFYSVEEVDCIGKGDKACVIVVDQRPLE